VNGDPVQVIFELQIVGASARMAAVDMGSGVEVVVVGPANAARCDLERLALRKLERALRQPEPAPRTRGRGVLL